jgi:hypothetical protein
MLHRTDVGDAIEQIRVRPHPKDYQDSEATDDGA